MPFGSYETPQAEKTPTLRQYCKTAKKTVQGKTKFGVQIVWLPGKFDNVTLQTHAFRVIVGPNHPLYTEILGYKELITFGNRYDRLDVIIDNVETAAFSVVESQRVAITWETLGSNGIIAKEI
jgi:hypothetical protein